MTLLETDRLKLCYMNISDAVFMLELLNTPKYYEFIGDRKVRTVEQAENYIVSGPVKSYDQFGFGYYVIKLKDTDQPVGICGLLKRETLEDVDVGFGFLPEHEGKGYGFESTSALMKWGVKEHNMKTITGITLENNISSIRLLEKLGLSFSKKIIMGDEELLLYSVTY